MNPRQEDLRPVYCFLAVAAELHFGRAAERLVLPQSTVSEQVKRLEKTLGGELFVRTTRRVELSPLGEVLLPEANRAVAGVEHAFEVGLLTASSGVVPLLLGTAMDVDHGELARALPLLRAQLPDLKVVPRPMRTAEQIDALQERRLHLGYVWEPPVIEGLESQLVGETGIVAFVPYDHELAEQDDLSVEELCGHPLVAWSAELNPWTRRRFTSICHKAGAEPLVVAEGMGFDDQVLLVLTNVGIGVTAASISSMKAVPGLTRIPVRSSLGFRRSLIWHRNERHPGVAALRSVVLDGSS